jgi:hypothetical protein
VSPVVHPRLNGGNTLRLYDIQHSTLINRSNIYVNRCSRIGCKTYLPYDGCDDHIYVYSHSTMITHRLMKFYEIHVASHSFYSFCNAQDALYRTHGDPHFFSLNTFSLAFFHWLSLRQLNYDATFTCPICIQLPLQDTIWTLDATSHSLQRSKLLCVDQWKQSMKPTVDAPFRRGLEPSQRIWLQPSAIRKLLKAWCSNSITFTNQQWLTLFNTYETANKTVQHI